MKIGNVNLKNRIILAPMAGVTDLPFRLLCARQGAGLVCTEMVSAKAILYQNKNTDKLMEIHPQEGHVSLQLFGSDPDIVSEAAKKNRRQAFCCFGYQYGLPSPQSGEQWRGLGIDERSSAGGAYYRKDSKGHPKASHCQNT